MRVASRKPLLTSLALRLPKRPPRPPLTFSASFFSPSRLPAQVHNLFPYTAFTPSGPPLFSPEECGLGPPHDAPPPDERTIKLGRTLRTLQARLPTLLNSPLPQEILSPHIALYLFPSTHPHLPSAHGRVAYHAALWTSPLAWGGMPLIGNIKLEILSERIVKNGSARSARGARETLIVRWRTCGKTRGLGTGALYRGIGAKQQVDKITAWLGGDARDDEEFCGIFVFEFDDEGRVLSHTIERAEQGGSWDVGRVVLLTDWLLGRFGRGKQLEGELALGYIENPREDKRHRRSD